MTHAQSVLEAPQLGLPEPVLKCKSSEAWHDITAAGRKAAFKVPMVLSSELWDRLTRGEPFDPLDFRLTELAWFLRFGLLRAGHAKLPSRPFLWTFVFGAAFDTNTGRNRCPVRPVVLPGENGPANVTLTLP
jgi:hypothetical protein